MTTGSVEGRVVTVPNLLSLARLATVPVFVWLFVSGRENAAVVLYGVGALSDFFDGFLARRLGAVTTLGKLLDPLADRVFIVALCIALLARGVLAPWLAGAIVARDVVLLALWPLLERRGVERIPVNIAGKAATAALLFGLTWLALSQTTFGWATIGETVGSAAVGVGAALYWAAALLYAREAAGRWRETRVREPLA
jgi:cardiolipin synthase (CMP-forming)